jgi:hypothetical protein
MNMNDLVVALWLHILRYSSENISSVGSSAGDLTIQLLNFIIRNI